MNKIKIFLKQTQDKEKVEVKILMDSMTHLTQPMLRHMTDKASEIRLPSEAMKLKT
jgi:hypothetical protein